MEIEIGRLFRAIRRFWWLPIVGAIVFGLVAGAANRAMPTTYTATTRMLIVPEEVAGQSVLGGSPNMLIDIATSTPVMQEVIEELGLDMTVAELRADTVVVVQMGTSILLVSVTNADPERSAEIANTIADKSEARAGEITMNELQSKRDELQFRSNELRDRLISLEARITILEDSDVEDESERDAELISLRDERLAVSQEKADIDSALRGLRAQIARTYSDVSVVESATVPQAEDGLSFVIVAIVGAFVGGLIGSALILLVAVRDHTVINAAQVARITGAPVLREISPANPENDVRLVGSLIRSLAQNPAIPNGDIRVIAPNFVEQLDFMAGEAGDTSGTGLALVNGISEREAALTEALSAGAAVIAVKIGVSTESDLRASVDTLELAGVPVLGSIVLRER